MHQFHLCVVLTARHAKGRITNPIRCALSTQWVTSEDLGEFSMKFRHLVKVAATIGLMTSPIAGQAVSAANVSAPQRASSSVEQGNEMRSSWIIGLLAIAAIIAAILIAAKDDNDPVSP